MSEYFHGRKRVGEFTCVVENGRGKINCLIFEEWVDIESGTTVYCGAEGSCSVKKTIGMGEKSSYTLKAVFESIIGVKDVLGLKSQVEEVIGKEVNWSAAVETSKSFPYKAPKCGRYTLTIYRLNRIFELTYFRKRRFTFGQEVWNKKWSRPIIEETGMHHALPDYDEFHEVCKCPNKKEPLPPDGQVIFDFGRISFRAPYRLTAQGLDIQIVEKIVSLSFADSSTLARGLEQGLDVSLPIALIPEPLLFLGDVHEKILDGRVQEFSDPGFLSYDQLPTIGRAPIAIQIKSHSATTNQ